MTKIYLIVGESGQYSDYTSSVVEAWSDEAKALSRHKQLSEQFAAAVKAYCEQMNRFHAHGRNYQRLYDYANARNTWESLSHEHRPSWEEFFAPLQKAEEENSRLWARRFWENEAPLLDPVYDRFYVCDVELDKDALAETLYHFD